MDKAAAEFSFTFTIYDFHSFIYSFPLSFPCLRFRFRPFSRFDWLYVIALPTTFLAQVSVRLMKLPRRMPLGTLREISTRAIFTLVSLRAPSHTATTSADIPPLRYFSDISYIHTAARRACVLLISHICHYYIYFDAINAFSSSMP